MPGDVVALPGGVRLRIDRAAPGGPAAALARDRLPSVSRVDYLFAHGRPVRYPYLERRGALHDLQNVYATVPGQRGDAERRRPLSEPVLVDLMAAGVVVAPLVLHTGVASQESHEPPQPEWFSVPDHTARLVKLTKQSGGRVVAVGTTVVRALESAAIGTPTEGWTDLVLGPERPARVVDGLLTGLHEPEASHLRLLEAVAGAELVDRAYADVSATAGAVVPLARAGRLDAPASLSPARCCGWVCLGSGRDPHRPHHRGDPPCPRPPRRASPPG